MKKKISLKTLKVRSFKTTDEVQVKGGSLRTIICITTPCDKTKIAQ